MSATVDPARDRRGRPSSPTRTGGELPLEELRSAEVHGQIDGMIETMRTTDGAGLGANEVGETLRIAVAGVRHGNPSTLTTWAQFERFHQDAFVEPARRLVDWVCS